MRAIVYKDWGGPEKLELTDVPEPTPKPNQVLLRVHATSVNPVDWKLASGKLRMVMPSKVPAIPGLDVAGEIVALGPGVTGFAVGDRAHARLGGLTGGGCGERVAVGLDVLAPMPAGMSFADAAALPLAGLTALQGLRDDALMPLTGATERVLVVGASGGVGHFAVQIARAAGATVVGVCSARNAALVSSLGANAVIDYAAPDPYKGQPPFDIVLDCVGASHSSWLPLLTPKGRYASTLPGPAVMARSLLNPFTSRRVRAVMLKSNAADLRILDELYAAGKLRAVIDSRFPLAEARRAWERSITGRAAGKIVIDVVT